jgi:hypothetical protein
MAITQDLVEKDGELPNELPRFLIYWHKKAVFEIPAKSGVFEYKSPVLADEIANHLKEQGDTEKVIVFDLWKGKKTIYK